MKPPYSISDGGSWQVDDLIGQVGEECRLEESTKPASGIEDLEERARLLREDTANLIGAFP